MIKKIKLFSLMLILSYSVMGQQFTQTLRGRIVDSDSRVPIFGANVIVQNSTPILGTSSDTDGYFEIKNVVLGRVDIKISAIGYESYILSNIVVDGGKETVLDVFLTESFVNLSEVSVSATEHKNEVLNNMATVSAKTVTVEETGRYAGSLNDPARMVSAFAGVAGDGSGNNDIVVRGNSPRGLLWRLEGIDIPNPTHFAEEGSTGGPISVLNSNMLANSDFFSGAFVPEYGNALSGVFDVRFRTGNSEKHEQTFTLGVLGTELNLEGPFSKKNNASYLVNYRYSTLELLEKTKILEFGGVPKYQDASFKINLPTKKYGSFVLFGLWGKSNMLQEEKDEEDVILEKNKMQNSLYVLGLKHHLIISEKIYLQSFISQTGSKKGFESSFLESKTNSFYQAVYTDSRENKYLFSTSLNNKLNSRNTIKTGLIFSLIDYDIYASHNYDHTQDIVPVDSRGNTSLLQLYSSWKYRIHENLSMTTGIHYTQLMLNNNYSIEPRLGFKWDVNPKNYLSLGLGLHSKIENISVYMTSENENNNRDLELTKSMHFVLGYGHQFNPNLFFKTEVYYQHLFDVPVSSELNSTYSILNESSGYITESLINKGTGKNYGFELTLERYFNKGFYYMLTSSLYQSKYTAIDEVERDTRFNGNYVGNIVFGKEFELPSKKNNKTLAVNVKSSLIGGNRYAAIDLESSIIAKETVYLNNGILTEKADDIFYINLGISYKVNRKKATHELKIDIQNITNNASVVSEYYSVTQEKIIPVEQLSLVPNIMYSIKF